MKDLSNLNSVAYKRSFFIGMLLGDAFSRRRDRKNGQKRVEFVVAHSEAQADLVRWKAGEVTRLLGLEIDVHENLNGSYRKVQFSFTAGKRVRVIHDWFHQGKRKLVTEKVRFLDHPIGLAMLLCDDGSVRKRKKKHKDGTVYYLKPNITIATHSFTKEEVELLLSHIQSVCGAVGYINPERRIRQGQLREYQRTNFNVENSRVLWEYVKDWIPQISSMAGKFSYASERFGT